MNHDADFPRLLTMFFTRYLMEQRQASHHTIAGYRDTFRLLVKFAQQERKKPPSELGLRDLEPAFVGAFLNHLEKERGNDARTRNTRLAAIRSFFRFVALHEPQHAALAQQILAMPSKRHTRRSVDFLDDNETTALVRAPDPGTPVGRRDRALLLVAVQTGVRASELIHLRCKDVHLASGAHLRCHGKGRKERYVPLRKDAATALRAWMKERRGEPEDRVFPNQRGRPLTHDSLDYLLAKHMAVAQRKCPSLRKKRVTPHTLRHSCAMSLLQNGVTRAIIALWLGHENVETTYIYLHADLKLKEQAMAKTNPVPLQHVRYRPEDDLLAFLNSL